MKLCEESDLVEVNMPPDIAARIVAEMRRLREVAEKKAEELAAKIDEAADRAYLDSPVGDGGDRQLPFRRR